jgi:hypothetical protein
MRCQAHGVGFTLYPFGHVPYGRRSIAPVAPDGTDLREEGEGVGAYSGTVFAAAVDASRGGAWPRESDGLAEHCWPSMCRRLSTALPWLGLTPEPGDKVEKEIVRKEREERAADLDVDLLPLQEGARAIEVAPGYRSRGTAVVRVLVELPTGRPLLERLLRAGHAAGLFGEPLVAVRPGGPLRSLAAERGRLGRSSPVRDPPRLGDMVPARGSP